MALYKGRLLMRGGNEADFDPDKMMPREWAVSTDKKIVRICVEPGMCIRMATYDAFEEDMAKIENILKECQSIQEAVVRINTEVNKNADAVAEYTAQAKSYMESAKTSAANAKTSENNSKTSEENAKTSETNAKVSEENAQAVFESLPEDYNTLSDEFYEVAIKQAVTGEQIHTTDSANAKVREFALFGKATQNTTSGKNLIPYPYNESSMERFGVTFTDLGDGTIHVNGTNTKEDGTSYLFLIGTSANYILPKGTYIISGTPIENNSDKKCWLSVTRESDRVRIATDKGSGGTFTLEEDTQVLIAIIINASATANNLIFKPMLRLADADDTWEQPTNGATPRPDYPQEIEVSGASGSVEVKSVGKNLYDRNKDLDRTNVGVTATISDGVMVLNGTATGNGALPAVGEEVNILNAKVGETFTLSVKILDGNANIETKTSLAYLSFRTKSGLNELTKTGSVTANENNIDKNTETSSITFTVTENMFNEDGEICVLCMNYIRGTEVFNNLKIGVQLEKGDKATEFQTYRETISTIPTPNGLAGKSVSSGGNYTDSNGQQRLCDRIVKYADGSGEHTQRVISEIFDGITNKVNAVNISTEYGVSFASSAKNNTLMNKLVVKSGNSYDLLCSHFVSKFALYNPSTTKDYGCGIYRTTANIWFSIDKDTASKIGIDVDTATVEQFNLWLQENPVTVSGILAEPITTQLTVEQLTEIEKLSTFYPVTNISNDFDCGMKVTYLADSKIYIDNQLAIQAQAQEEAMAAMLLLLPEETQAAMVENDTNNLLTESEE